MERDPLKPPDAMRRRAVLVLYAAKLALDG